MIVDTIGHVMSQRALRWDMSTIYPGLMMTVTPSANGVLEFIMDPHQESLDQLKTVKEIGTSEYDTCSQLKVQCFYTRAPENKCEVQRTDASCLKKFKFNVTTQARGNSCSL